MLLDAKLRQLAESEGADFFGVADLTLAWQAICDEDPVVNPEYSQAISIGIALLSTIVDRLP